VAGLLDVGTGEDVVLVLSDSGGLPGFEFSGMVIPRLRWKSL
jgi:hypothetical protein